MSASDWSELDGYEGLVSELRANPPVAPERLRQRVLEGAPAARAPRSRKRKLVLVVAPAAGARAVEAALVHGFVNSGSGPRAEALPARIVHGASNQVPQTLGPLARKRVATTARTQSKSYGAYNLDQNTAVASGKLGAVEAAPL